jgi:hypothetical protein
MRLLREGIEMKTAEEIIRDSEACYGAQEDELRDLIAKITAFADERVKEVRAEFEESKKDRTPKQDNAIEKAYKKECKDREELKRFYNSLKKQSINIRNYALEEAAKIADKWVSNSGKSLEEWTAKSIAEEIRSLKAHPK